MACYPHAALALSCSNIAKSSTTSATWGSEPSTIEDSTTAPEDEDQGDEDDLESSFSLDDELAVGPDLPLEQSAEEAVPEEPMNTEKETMSDREHGADA